jgi:hypothetical protein
LDNHELGLVLVSAYLGVDDFPLTCPLLQTLVRPLARFVSRDQMILLHFAIGKSLPRLFGITIHPINSFLNIFFK